eukprot:CAMPEP_0179176694 /NCGR_PEP_ID=MMETSP0796-20121207/87373_1 /TAXON_ID=73915 /ORGANISM="Pyrodinium bahamense, Strain pbaha01" /LENGTH=730 /DNA_ID=CAMNT_0020880235 /DNA_START=55 /DNA_END=2246 /DNA_ORIENTATION=-
MAPATKKTAAASSRGTKKVAAESKKPAEEPVVTGSRGVKKPAAEPKTTPGEAAEPAAPGSRGAKKVATEGAGLQRFFGARPSQKEEEVANASSTEATSKTATAPLNSLQKFFAAQARKGGSIGAGGGGSATALNAAETVADPMAAEVATAPSPVPVPAATTPVPSTAPAASPATGSPPQLSNEQLARIEENRRRARERQQAKRSREGEDDEAKPDEEQQTPSPLRPAAARAAVPGEAVATPEKVMPPYQERRHSPAPAAAAGEGGMAGPGMGQRVACGGGGRFATLECGAWLQYNNLYYVRLRALRRAVLEEARGLWGGMLPPEAFLPEITGYRRSSEGSEVVLIGVLFKDLKGRPNVIEQYKDVKVRGSLGEGSEEDALRRLSSEDDVLWLEDSSMRLQLVASREQVGTLFTGLVLGVRGTATSDGNFQISAVCFPRMASPPPLAPSVVAGGGNDGEGPFLALVSGLACGAEGEAAGLATVAAHHRGGTFATAVGGAPKAVLREADELLSTLAAAMRVDVMPGRGDPTNLTLPQMPLHPHLFKRVRECRDFRSVSNPYEGSIDGLNVLGHSGQPVEDLLRCTELGSPLEALATCLRASHLAPTAPDTLATQPFASGDPFVLEDVPHVLFSGGHESEGHQWHPSPRGSGGTLCVCVPAFHRRPAVVLVNLRDPRDVRVQEFLSPADAGREADVQMGEAANANAETEAAAAAAARRGVLAKSWVAAATAAW